MFSYIVLYVVWVVRLDVRFKYQNAAHSLPFWCVACRSCHVLLLIPYCFVCLVLSSSCFHWILTFLSLCASICFIKCTIFNLYQQSKGKRLIQCCPLLRYKFKKVTIKSLKLHTCLLPFSLHINCMGDRVMDEFIFILPGLVCTCVCMTTVVDDNAIIDVGCSLKQKEQNKIN